MNTVWIADRGEAATWWHGYKAGECAWLHAKITDDLTVSVRESSDPLSEHRIVYVAVRGMSTATLSDYIKHAVTDDEAKVIALYRLGVWLDIRLDQLNAARQALSV